MEINRRQFLEIGTRTAVGITTGYSLYPVMSDLNRITTEITGNKAGNAGTAQKIEEACASTPDKQKCIENYTHDPLDTIRGTFLSPVSEEMAFRAIPSLVLSTKEDSEDPFGEMLAGNRTLGFTRREVVWGAALSLGFGAAHNLTGIDTKTIPASQTLGGAVLWVLQRKLGLLSNTLAHFTINFKYYFKV